jgi:hypothetical protein
MLFMIRFIMTWLQLHPISDDLGKILRQFGPEKYAVSRCLAAQEDNHFFSGHGRGRDISAVERNGFSSRL